MYCYNSNYKNNENTNNIQQNKQQHYTQQRNAPQIVLLFL